MPENPNIDPDTEFDGFYGTNVTMATTANNNNNNRKQGAPRVSSAGIKYYDIATQLLGKNGSDLEELFIAAARDGVYERIENFLQRNRTEYFVCIDVKDKKTGNTPLIWAAKRGHAKIVQLLLRHGADITLRNYEGHTALEVASPSIRAILLESVERSTEASHQLLLQAAWQGDIKVVSRLLGQKKVLDINCQNADGYTPVMLATRDMQLFERLSTQMSRSYNPVEVVSELLSSRADLHATDGDGKTCLHHASSSKAQIAQTVVSTIIAGGPNLEQKDKRCFAPLHCASLTGNAECIGTLLDGGSEVNSRGFAGATALHITSYNNHERATSVLLEHGANVTLTDDRGLNPLDFAKTRKMRKRLQEAWTEATTNTRSQTSLGPIRAHSREDLRSSVEDLTKRKKGEVIFEGLPSNPFSDSTKKDSIANAKGLTRHLSLKDKNGKDDEYTQSHLRDGVRKLGQVRNQQKPSPLPRTKSRSTERLPMISPDRTGSDRNLESPVMFGRNSRARRSFEDRQRRGRKVPLSTREGSNLGEDVFDRLTPGPPSPTPSVHHRRSESDPNRGTPNLMEIAASCDPYLHNQRRGRSYSVNSNQSNDPDSNRLTPNHGEFTPLQRESTIASVQREATLMSICSYRTESRMSTNSNSPRMLNLGQMLSKCKTPVQPLYGPGSSKVIPPSPAFITQRCPSNMDGRSDMDISPRSDEDFDVPPELCRSKSIFKDEFILEESRPKDPFIQSSSGSDTVSSSGSSHLSSSPRDSPLSMKGRGLRTGKPNSVKPTAGQMAVTGFKPNQQVTGSIADNVGSGNNNNTRSKVNDKSGATSSPGQSSNVVSSNTVQNGGKSENVVPKVKGGNANKTNSTNNSSVLHSMAMRNATVLNANKGSSVNTGGNKNGANKSGGTILVHTNNDVSGNNGEKEKTGASAVSNSGKINNTNNDNKSTKEPNTQHGKSGNVESKGSENKTVTTAKSDNKSVTQNAVSSAKQKAQKQMKSILKVVPTKLTENIIRTAPKANKEESSVAKTVSNNANNNNGKTVTGNSGQSVSNVSNVNMELSQSAQVVNRVSNQGNNANNASVKQTDNKTVEDKNVKTVTQDAANNQGNNNANVVANTGNEKQDGNGSAMPQNQNRTNSQPQSAQNIHRQGAQSRNANFNVSKSAVPGSQRQMGNVRKTNSGYTPRFQSGLNSKPGSSQSNKNGTTNEVKQPQNTGATNYTNGSKTDLKTLPVKSSSPTELVAPSVSKTASISKSYNMAPAQTLTKSSSSGSIISDSTSATKTNVINSVKVEPNSVKRSVVSKSVSDPLQASGKVSNAGIVSKSVSQMPSVGTVLNEKSATPGPAKGLLRSSSMSTIEEKKEKKLMSSSDTKILAEKGATTKRRPSSDGPVGVTSGKESPSKISGTSKPLIEILPDGARRINRKNYIDINNPLATPDGPVIVNPFEELEQKREKENLQKLDGRALTATEFGFVIDKGLSVERSKTQVSMKRGNTKNAKKGGTKPTSAQSRTSSARKKKSLTKEANKSDNESSRPKSGQAVKRVRSGKRKRKVPVNLAKENEKDDVALIGGIGWQIATSCIDKSEADAVIVSQIDSSESESECVDVLSGVGPLRLNIPADTHLQIPNAIETPSSLSSPRFKEVRPTFDVNPKEALHHIDDDGYRPMNLDMTQSSSGNQNRSGVLIGQEMPGDISDFLSQLREDKTDVFSDEEDYDDNTDYDGYEDENGNLDNLIHKGIALGQLTPIPESPSLRSTTMSATPQRMVPVTKTVEAALQRFDQNVKEDELNNLLGSTPRDKSSNYSRDYSSTKADKGSAASSRTNPLRNSGSAQSQKDSTPSSAQSKNHLSSRNSSSKSRTTNLSGDIKERANKALSKSMPSPKGCAGEAREKTNSGIKSGGSLRKSTSREKLDRSQEFDVSQSGSLSFEPKFNSLKRSDSNSETKERIDTKILDLKKLLADKMQSTQKLLEETASYSSYKKKPSENSNENMPNTSQKNDVKIDIGELTEENLRALDTTRTDDEAKSTRSSRKERRFSETKNDTKEDEIDEVIDEILSNTFPSSRSTLKSNSLRSASNTLTEVDRSVLLKMVQDNQVSPFHAKESSVRVSSSYDETVTLNKDNPDLMRKFHAGPGKFKMGQRVKAMVDAGAEKSKVKAMVKADNEAKQLAKIMNSFKQMELYAGNSNNRSAKKETPRRDGEHMVKSMSKFDHNVHSHSHQSGMPPRPGSAGGMRSKPGKFTEIKGGKSATTEKRDRTQSPVNVPKDLAEEFKRSPFVRVSHQQDTEHFDELANVIRPGTPDSDDDHVSLADSEHERADSACTTLSSHSSIMEETIQWKKGNVLGKGAFGTVWCGLTSEGHLIAVKQIELNTTNHHKAKKEYEKVQEEVELLKTLEHKNIVGYLGTSLEESIVSIFMQFVPGGSIASILARFGALDEAVFRKYTRQILEGVEYLHENDVIHRDIKGGNVMLMPNGVIKLIDFGCAKRLCINMSMGQSQILKSMKGTPYWMAPEVVNETGHGKKSDIWSVGCTVFEMATRKPPWADMNPMAAIFAIGSDKPVPQLPEKFSEEAREFVNCCLTKDQSKRLSATELLVCPFLKRRAKKSSSNC